MGRQLATHPAIKSFQLACLFGRDQHLDPERPTVRQFLRPGDEIVFRCGIEIAFRVDCSMMSFVSWRRRLDPSVGVHSLFDACDHVGEERVRRHAQQRIQTDDERSPLAPG